jgi:hypothetical protein
MFEIDKPFKILDVAEYQKEWELLLAPSLKKVLFYNVFEKYYCGWFRNHLQVAEMLTSWQLDLNENNTKIGLPVGELIELKKMNNGNNSNKTN